MIEQEQVENINQASSNVTTYLQEYGPRLVISIILFFIFSKVINIFIRYLDSFLKKRRIDPKITEVTINLIRYVLYLLLILALASFIGLNIGIVVLMVLAAIAVVAFTMQNTLVNVGAGFVVVGLKLFKKGDYLEYDGVEGNVRNIDIYHTEIIRSDNSIVFIPNSDLLNSKFANTDKRI